jgi:hypothetical protein
MINITILAINHKTSYLETFTDDIICLQASDIKAGNDINLESDNLYLLTATNSKLISNQTHHKGTFTFRQ